MIPFRTVCTAGGVLLATAILFTARADDREVLRYSYTPTSKGRPGEDALERLRKAAEGIEGSSAVNLLVRIAEISGDSADYERAFLADTNSVEAVCGLVATKSSRDASGNRCRRMKKESLCRNSNPTKSRKCART